MNISLLFYGIPSEYMSISYTVHLHQNKHDLPWFCKKKNTEMFPRNGTLSSGLEKP